MSPIAFLTCIVATIGVPGPLDTVSAPTAGSDSLHVRIYVPNQLGSSISVLDGEGQLLTTVELPALGFSRQAMPHQVVAAPDGSRWYVTLARAGFVLAFDRDNRLVGQVAVEAPGMIVYDAARDRLYVSRALVAVRPPSSLVVLRASDLSIVEQPEMFISRPHGLAVDPVSGRVYVGSVSNGSIAVHEPDSGEVHVIDVAEAPNGFVGLAVSPDGRRLVATTQITNRLLALDASDSAELPLVAALDVKAGPYDATFSPDGRYVWFPNQRAGTVTRVDAAGWSIGAVLRHPAFAEPHGVVVAPDGKALYVTSHGRSLASEADIGAATTSGAFIDMTSPRANGTLAVIDVGTGEIRAVTEVGPYAAAPGIAVNEGEPGGVRMSGGP